MESLKPEQATQIAAAREAYFRHGQFAAEHLRSSVWRSWNRCQAAGHEPKFRLEPAAIGRRRIHEVEERSRSLIVAAREELDHMASVVRGSGLVAMLADETGTIVHTAGDTAALSPRLRLAARQGMDLSEKAAGTNAIGTAMVDKTLVSIVAQEHFFESDSGLACVAAPLFGATGSLVGVLDLSGDYNPTRPDCAEVVRTAACAIENKLLRELQDVMFVALSPHEQFLGTPTEGLLAFDPAGRLVAANGRARAFLGIADGGRIAFDDLFKDARFGDVVGGPDAADRRLSLTSVAGLRFAARSEPAREARATRPHMRRPVTPVVPSPEAKNSSALTLLRVVTEDARTADAFSDARRALDHNVPVLLAGETGTGKELFARALHCSGLRSSEEFIALNCAALPESLIEGELFGHGEGAFTGARRGGAPGKIENADGGTLFLDEIGDMPIALQTRLLRILQERVVVRLGEIRERPIDIAVICASNRDLQDLVARRLFREDLYYRINGLRVTLPPLRERTNLLEIADHFLSYRDRSGRGLELSKSAREIILRHSWPGNLRELDHVLTVAAAFVPPDGRVVRPEHFPRDFVATANVDDPVSRGSPLPTFDQATADLIERTVLAHDGNVAAAARALKVSRSTIYHRWSRAGKVR